MGYSEDMEGWPAYYRLQDAVHELIDGVESNDIDFETLVERLKEISDY